MSELELLNTQELKLLQDLAAGQQPDVPGMAEVGAKLLAWYNNASRADTDRVMSLIDLIHYRNKGVARVGSIHQLVPPEYNEVVMPRLLHAEFLDKARLCAELEGRMLTHEQRIEYVNLVEEEARTWQTGVLWGNVGEKFEWVRMPRAIYASMVEEAEREPPGLGELREAVNEMGAENEKQKAKIDELRAELGKAATSLERTKNELEVEQQRRRNRERDREQDIKYAVASAGRVDAALKEYQDSTLDMPGAQNLLGRMLPFPSESGCRFVRIPAETYRELAELANLEAGTFKTDAAISEELMKDPRWTHVRMTKEGWKLGGGYLTTVRFSYEGLPTNITPGPQNMKIRTVDLVGLVAKYKEAKEAYAALAQEPAPLPHQCDGCLHLFRGEGEQPCLSCVRVNKRRGGLRDNFNPCKPL